jgi:hypothetical protein
MPPGGQSVGRGGPRAGWAAIVGIAIGALLLAGVKEPRPAVSAPPAVVAKAGCVAAKQSARALAVRRAVRPCAMRGLYP